VDNLSAGPQGPGAVGVNKQTNKPCPSQEALPDAQPCTHQLHQPTRGREQLFVLETEKSKTVFASCLLRDKSKVEIRKSSFVRHPNHEINFVSETFALTSDLVGAKHHHGGKLQIQLLRFYICR